MRFCVQFRGFDRTTPRSAPASGALVCCRSLSDIFSQWNYIVCAPDCLLLISIRIIGLEMLSVFVCGNLSLHRGLPNFYPGYFFANQSCRMEKTLISVLILRQEEKCFSPNQTKTYIKWKTSWHECPKTYGGRDYLSTWSRHILGHSCHEFFHLHDKNGGCRAANFRQRAQIQTGTVPKKVVV